VTAIWGLLSFLPMLLLPVLYYWIEIRPGRLARRACVTCRGEVAAILAGPDEPLCDEHDDARRRINWLEVTTLDLDARPRPYPLIPPGRFWR
jgi:hypothetical protein